VSSPARVDASHRYLSDSAGEGKIFGPQWKRIRKGSSKFTFLFGINMYMAETQETALRDNWEDQNREEKGVERSGEFSGEERRRPVPT
jgi:hypothetical protein